MTKEESQKGIGLALLELRKASNVTQVELAERTGLTQNHIWRIETGKYNVGFYQVQLIADTLGYEIRFIKKEE